MIIARYISRLLGLWITWAFILVDAVAFATGALRPALQMEPWMYWAMGALGFLVANIKLFARTEDEKAKLVDRLEELEASEASIQLRFQSTVFSHTSPVLTLQGRYGDGIRTDGLPIRATIYSRVEIENTGWERGELRWEVDKDKSELPEIFTLYEDRADGQFQSFDGFLDGRSRAEDFWQLECGITETDPAAFADALRELDTFRVVLRYHTKRIGDQNPETTLTMEGSFSEYREKLLTIWREHGLNDLVAGARISRDKETQSD